MSEALYGLGGLRFWHEHEITAREAFILLAQTAMVQATNMPMYRCEGPILQPRSMTSAAYSDDDIFVTNDSRGGDTLCLRPETTQGSYAYADWLIKRARSKSAPFAEIPFCVWQAGISSRRETNDGASAAKLRFNSFWQQEFQFFYGSNHPGGPDGVVDRFHATIDAAKAVITYFTKSESRLTVSDRLPAYSVNTLDIEVKHKGKWREVASCSLRTDFKPDVTVCEIAIGLDRAVTIRMENI